MLVLSRKSDESIFIGENIEVVILEVRGTVARIGIKAPREVPVVRSEVSRRGVATDFQRVSEESYVDVPVRSPNLETEQRNSQILHNFCERRKSWRMANIESSKSVAEVTSTNVLSFG